MKKDSPSEFLTIRELSKWIRLSRSHIYCLVSKKKIPFIKLGGKLLFSSAEIRKWVDQSSYNPITEKSTTQKERQEKSN
jgi:excisionase family DNA binding protein